MKFLLNDLLLKLPLNGYKSIIGGVITALYYAYPDLPKAELGQLGDILAQVIGIGGQLYLIFGVLHKYVKSKI